MSTSIFSAVEGAAWGKIAAKHSENFVERLARVGVSCVFHSSSCSFSCCSTSLTTILTLLQYLNNKMTWIESYVLLHPLHAVFFVGCVFVLVFLGLRRFVGDDVAGEREYGNTRKGGRLD